MSQRDQRMSAAVMPATPWSMADCGITGSLCTLAKIVGRVPAYGTWLRSGSTPRVTCT
jgi:hypothetical protein